MKHEMPVMTEEKNLAMTQERLKGLLHYDPENGQFTWLRTNSNRAAAGTIAGTINNRGYRMVKIDGKLYNCARLAFLYMNGFWPVEADHINRIRHDNRWVNLRNATRGQNEANKGPRSNNTSGAIGVHLDTQSNRWRVGVRIDGKHRHVGYFEDFELAELVASEARAKLHGVYAS